ncbi:hypothetical protein DR864_11220 [Runella rosea]|uniref:Uncharacterized protein n=1 Tax=Runella rosea TaxID=2259595 RepID=A0A344TI03_9BACT|nr:hypothetical protein DR864_11220 [Runella rosea]
MEYSFSRVFQGVEYVRYAICTTNIQKLYRIFSVFGWEKCVKRQAASLHMQTAVSLQMVNLPPQGHRTALEFFFLESRHATK